MDDHDRHFYLYAKGWYQEHIITLDLKILLGRYCAISPNSLSNSDVAHKLISLIERHIKNRHQFKDFILRIFHTKGDVTLFFRECLTVLALVTDKDLGFKLGDPDPGILPLKEKKQHGFFTGR